MKKSLRKKLIFLVIIGVLILYIWQENTVFQTTEIIIADTEIPHEFNEYCIVQISDMHIGRIGVSHKALLEEIRQNEPDIIVVTGDLIDSQCADMDKAVALMESAIEIAPVYFVTGNHEMWLDDREQLEQRLTDAGVVLLDDTSVEIEKNQENIHLMGVHDGSYEIPLTVEENQYYILLAHCPERFNRYAERNVDLVFSGHAHGGQFRLPFVGGIVAPDQGLFPEYTSGVYEQGDTRMVVSRGLGNSLIPIRVNNNPELVVVHLEKK